MVNGGLDWFGFDIKVCDGLGDDDCVVFWRDISFNLGCNINIFIEKV